MDFEFVAPSSWDAAAAIMAAIDNHKPGGRQRLCLRQRIVRTTLRTLTAPDGTRHRVWVPLVELVADGLEAAPRRRSKRPRSAARRRRR